MESSIPPPETSELIKLEFSYEEDDVTKVRTIGISPQKHEQLEAIITANSGSSAPGKVWTQDGFAEAAPSTETIGFSSFKVISKFLS
jgi:hypothetical protein